jgi:hypothetical protein
VNDDDRLHRYLTDRAEGITLAPGNADAVVRRASRRRLRRRGVVLTSAAVLSVVGTTAVLRHGDSDQSVHVAGNPGAAPSTYHWSVVKPGHGLAYSNSQAELADGSVYSISSAPGPYDPNKANQGTGLYRTADGKEWAQVDGPSGVTPSDLAATGDDLYALGTAPAGGGAKSVALATRHGGGDWTTVPLPDDLTALQARHPGQIAIGSLQLAAEDATHLVATVQVGTKLDPQQLRPELKDQNVRTTWTDTGLDVRPLPDCAANGDSPVAGADAEQVKAAGIECRTQAKDAAEGPVTQHYSWDELGIDPELRTLVGGRTYAYATSDGHTFQPVDLPGAAKTYPAGLVALPDGFHLILQDAASGATSTVLGSTDGRTWTPEGTLAGSPQSAGVLAGHLAVSTTAQDGTTDVQVRQADGSWHPLGLASAVPTSAGGSAFVGEVAFGPLGVAATAGTFHGKDGGLDHSYVLHSSDGSSVSVEDIGAALGSPRSPVGILVTADAIAVRLSDPSPDAGKPGHVPTQTVLVGTPPG